MELCWIIYFIVCGVLVLITGGYIWLCIEVNKKSELTDCHAVNSLLIQIEPFIYDDRLTEQKNQERLWLYCLELFKEIYDLEPKIFVSSYKIASHTYINEAYLDNILRLMCHEELLERNAKGFRFVHNSETTSLLADVKPIPKE